jgi:hypothetical protein
MTVTTTTFGCPDGAFVNAGAVGALRISAGDGDESHEMIK